MTAPNDFGLGMIGGTTLPSNLLYPGLSQMIVQTALPAQVARQLYQYLPTGGKESMTIPVEDGSPTARGARVGEGDQIPLDVAPVGPNTVRVYKVGRGHPVTREEQLFQQIPMIQNKLIRLGLVMGNTIDYDGITVALAGAYSGSTVGAAGKSLFMDGTEGTLAGTIGQKDLKDAKKNIRGYNYEPDTLVVNPTGMGFLEYLPHYSAEFLYGKPAYMNGERGQIEGLRILVTNNMPSGNALLATTGANSTALQQYSPMGYFLEGQPISTHIYDAGNKDQYEVYATTFYNYVVSKGKALAKITY